MTTIVVLGPPRAGHGLMAAVLEALGIGKAQGLGRLNIDLLGDCRGSWRTPPALEDLAETGHRWRYGIEAAVLNEQGEHGETWAWSDPLTALTIPIVHAHLQDPRYIVLRRDWPDVAGSLIEQAGPGEWDKLALEYERRIADFVATCHVPVHTVRFEDLTHPKAARLAVRRLATFLGVDAGRIDAALTCIQYKDRWGFGRIGIGTPYYGAEYEFFRWWSWVLVGGLEVGDKLLNTPDLRCEVPIPLAHNGLVKEFLKTDADTLVIVEDDHCGQQDTIRQIRFKVDNQRFDIICASYVNRRDPIDAVVGFNFTGNMNEYGEVDCLLEPMKVWKTGTQPHDGAALGLVFIRRWVVEAMLDGGDPDEYFWFDWRGRNSQDIVFYWRAREVGATCGVDRDNPVGHVGKKVYTMEQFYMLRDEFLAREKAKTEVTQDG